MFWISFYNTCPNEEIYFTFSSKNQINKPEITTKILQNGKYINYKVSSSSLFYWVYLFSKKPILLSSGYVLLKTIGSNSIGYILTTTPSSSTTSSTTNTLKRSHSLQNSYSYNYSYFNQVNQDYSCQIYEIILNSNSSSHLFYINSANIVKDVYLSNNNYNNYIGTVSTEIPLNTINQSYNFNYTVNEVIVSFCEHNSLSNCISTPEGSAYIPIGSSLFYINYLQSKSKSKLLPDLNKSDILVFTPYGTEDYRYSGDDFFNDDGSEPFLSQGDWVGVGCGIIVLCLFTWILWYYYGRKQPINYEKQKNENKENESNDILLTTDKESINF